MIFELALPVFLSKNKVGRILYRLARESVLMFLQSISDYKTGLFIRLSFKKRRSCWWRGCWRDKYCFVRLHLARKG